jgi:NADPH2:quinone reductase
LKALLCTQFGPPERLEYRDVPSPRPGPHEVLVSVKAASVNFPDVLIIRNQYQSKAPLPFSPGSELAGVVTATGADVTGLHVGDRVMATTFHGAFAEEVAVDAARVHPMPDGIEFPAAAALLFTYGTMHHALCDRGALAPSDTVLVLGAAGGIGLASVEIAKAIGARVIACASNADKLAVCRARGADAVIDYTTEDLRGRIKALTDGRGVDVVVDPVGGPLTELALRSTAWRGRLLVVGFASGEIPRIPLNLVLLKGCSLVGVFWGDFIRREPRASSAAVEQLVAWYQAGRVRPHISATFPLSRGAEALALMDGRKVVGKVIIEP